MADSAKKLLILGIVIAVTLAMLRHEEKRRPIPNWNYCEDTQGRQWNAAISDGLCHTPDPSEYF